jgi:hypothetical protein
MVNQRMTRLAIGFRKKKKAGDLFHVLQLRSHPSNGEGRPSDSGGVTVWKMPDMVKVLEDRGPGQKAA